MGGTAPVRVDIRVIAATHRDLEGMADQGKFRADLYFRLGVFPISIPPLRERKADIPALVRHFIIKKSREMKRVTVPSLAPDALDRLMVYHWPGNIRELENAVERSLILHQGNLIFFKEICGRIKNTSVKSSVQNHIETEELLELDAVISRHIRQVLNLCGGRVEGDRGAARLLNIHPSTLRKRMRKLGIPFGRKAEKTGSPTPLF